MNATSPTSAFLGWRVVAGAFVVAVFGWGLGFSGPPIYLHAVSDARVYASRDHVSLVARDSLVASAVVEWKADRFAGRLATPNC